MLLSVYLNEIGEIREGPMSDVFVKSFNKLGVQVKSTALTLEYVFSANAKYIYLDIILVKGGHSDHVLHTQKGL